MSDLDRFASSVGAGKNEYTAIWLVTPVVATTTAHVRRRERGGEGGGRQEHRLH